jgi:hypothetical protein
MCLNVWRASLSSFLNIPPWPFRLCNCITCPAQLYVDAPQLFVIRARTSPSYIHPLLSPDPPHTSNACEGFMPYLGWGSRSAGDFPPLVTASPFHMPILVPTLSHARSQAHTLCASIDGFNLTLPRCAEHLLRPSDLGYFCCGCQVGGLWALERHVPVWLWVFRGVLRIWARHA